MDHAPVQEGDILAGKYKIERMLAAGGMGVVVAAMHEQLDQRVALKFLLPEGAANTEAVGRFLREARAAVRLRSEHVAKVLDVGTLDTGSPYIVMEYLEGRDLQALLIERGSLPARTAVSYVLQACEAIAEAHAHGIVHRDLKPGNLFLTRRNDGTACIKVLDFGISKLPQGPLQGGMTKTSAVMGTPYYISPEQLRASKNADSRSDIWALGMILYELLTGSVAFPRDTLPELCTAIIYDPVPDFSTHGVEVVPSLVSVVMRCLEKSPEHRYQTLAELGSALAAFVTNGEASAERISRILDPNERSGSIQPPPEAKPGPAAAATQVSTPDIAEPPASVPIPSAITADTRRDNMPDMEEAFGDEAALPAQALVPNRVGRGPRLALAAAVGAAIGVIALLWLVQTMVASPPAAVSNPSVVPATQPAAESPAPIVLAAEPAHSVALEPLAAEPAVSAAAAPAAAKRAGAPVAAPRSGAPGKRPADGDDFGFRK